MPCVSLKVQAARRSRARQRRAEAQAATRRHQTRVGARILSATNTPLKLTADATVRIRPHRQATAAAPAKKSRQTLKSEKKAAKASRQLAKTAARQSRKAVRQATHQTITLRRRPSRADLINAESRLGSQLFGPIPEGHRREFFHDRENIWIWHEDWTDETHHRRQLTVRYEIRPSGVFKKLSAGKYVKLEGGELENFRRATHAYLRVIKQELYHV